ncbi:MAG TPA: hypothetical protein VMV94_00810 [Phycisphaerae bacterium]|nr:hypothetical protein [Phycisphaerae bacterium]
MTELPGKPTLNPLIIAAVFAALAVLLAAGPWRYQKPYNELVRPPAWATDISPVRRPILRPEIRIAGFTYRCSECHSLFPSPPETVRTLTQHTDVVLKHGINTRCFNCHNLTNRDTFVDDWGREIPYDQPQLVCAKCHGPVYRDWLHGSHGRVNGYWDATRGPAQRRKCVECHDPHQPPFPPMRPAPPPQTLRMGDQSFSPEHQGVTDPLRVYRHALPEGDKAGGLKPEPEMQDTAEEGWP